LIKNTYDILLYKEGNNMNLELIEETLSNRINKVLFEIEIPETETEIEKLNYLLLEHFKTISYYCRTLSNKNFSEKHRKKTIKVFIKENLYLMHTALLRFLIEFKNADFLRKKIRVFIVELYEICRPMNNEYLLNIDSLSKNERDINIKHLYLRELVNILYIYAERLLDLMNEYATDYTFLIKILSLKEYLKNNTQKNLKDRKEIFIEHLEELSKNYQSNSRYFLLSNALNYMSDQDHLYKRCIEKLMSKT
jgi:hypothetical protein